MHLDRLPPGDNPPDNVNVMIEVPVRSDPIKYEMDKDSGALFVDRILGTAMHYPVNYGFIPNTLSGDGDPVDVMVLCDIPIQSGALIKVRPIGVMMMTDDGGEDEKILAVPVRKISSLYEQFQTHEDVPESLRKTIEHFFSHYKDLEEGKWAKVDGWGGPDEARGFILRGIERVSGKK